MGSKERAALDRFGELLMRRIRDEAISDWDMILDGTMKDERSQKVRAELAGLDFDSSQVAFIRWLIPQVVDTTLHHLLWTLEQEETVNVAVKTEGAEIASLREASDGLAGELYSEDGWIARFSKERKGEVV